MNINQECSMSQEGILLNLQKGLDSEYRARDICQEALNILEDEADRAQIQRIIDDEEKHIKITENLITVVKSFYVAEYQK